MPIVYWYFILNVCSLQAMFWWKCITDVKLLALNATVSFHSMTEIRVVSECRWIYGYTVMECLAVQRFKSNFLSIFGRHGDLDNGLTWSSLSCDYSEELRSLWYGGTQPNSPYRDYHRVLIEPFGVRALRKQTRTHTHTQTHADTRTHTRRHMQTHARTHAPSPFTLTADFLNNSVPWYDQLILRLS